jgi:hypothetical protein
MSFLSLSFDSYMIFTGYNGTDGTDGPQGPEGLIGEIGEQVRFPSSLDSYKPNNMPPWPLPCMYVCISCISN